LDAGTQDRTPGAVDEEEGAVGGPAVAEEERGGDHEEKIDEGLQRRGLWGEVNGWRFGR